MPFNHEILREANALCHRLPVLSTIKFKTDFYDVSKILFFSSECFYTPNAQCLLFGYFRELSHVFSKLCFRNHKNEALHNALVYKTEKTTHERSSSEQTFFTTDLYTLYSLLSMNGVCVINFSAPVYCNEERCQPELQCCERKE